MLIRGGLVEVICSVYLYFPLSATISALQRCWIELHWKPPVPFSLRTDSPWQRRAFQPVVSDSGWRMETGWIFNALMLHLKVTPSRWDSAEMCCSFFCEVVFCTAAHSLCDIDWAMRGIRPSPAHFVGEKKEGHLKRSARALRAALRGCWRRGTSTLNSMS